MIKKTYRITFLFLVLLSSCNMIDQPHITRVGYLGLDQDGRNDKEINDVFDFLNSIQNIEVKKINTGDIKNATPESMDYDIIWIHRPDSSDFSAEETDPALLKNLREYVENDGRLLLTLDAVFYVHILGYEDNKPQVRYKKATDSGYGRMLGLHSFRDHPVFDGLNGGAYINKPLNDINVRQIGYFEKNIPGNGKVVAVDWDYIFIREEKKLVMEYDIDDGKILAIGAYTYFNQPNFNKPHLEKFILNSIDYLTDKPLNSKVHYWIYGQNEVLPFEHQSDTLKYAKPCQWQMSNESISLVNNSATGNFWDLAGQRLLVMGNEQGGIEEIWAHPFMALRDYEAGIQFLNEDTVYWLNNEQPGIEVNPESFTRIYKFKQAYLKEVIVADPDNPYGIVHYEYKGAYPGKIIVRFKSNLRLMWPYSEKVLGTIQYTFDKGLNVFVILDQSHDFVCLLGSDKIPDTTVIGHYDGFSKEEPYQGLPTDKFQVSGLFTFDLAKNDNLDLIFSATNEGLEQTIHAYRQAAVNPEHIYLSSLDHCRQFYDKALSIISPDSIFNEGYRWALIATDRFFVHTPGIGSSFVAGYSTTAKGWGGGHTVNGRPGYGWYFGRDGEWCGFAILDYGDFEKVRSMLRMFQKYQDLNGKILHELSTSGFIHYDASDATPLYIVLAGKYLNHSGDIDFIRNSWHHIKNAIDYCYSTDRDGDMLIENTNVGHGWVEGGHLFGSHSSLYLTSCWAAALKNASYMAKSLGYEKLADKYNTDADKVIHKLNNEFWNSEANYFYHGLFRDGSYHRSKTIMPTIPIYFGQIEKDKSNLVLTALAGNNYTSDWGVRIVGEDHPQFNPGGYHTGSVWPLFTGWTALAEYNNGNCLQGFSHVMSNLNVYQDWGLGFVEEVLHGETYKPFGVCPHQCWSETMVIQPIIEGMLGLVTDATENTIILKPCLPANWDYLFVGNIRLGNHYIDMNMERDSSITKYVFKSTNDAIIKVNFEPIFPYGTKFDELIINGEPTEIKSKKKNQGEQLITCFVLEKETNVIVHHSHGIAVIPLVCEVKPGHKSNGFRIISTEFKDNTLLIDLEGNSGAREYLEVYLNDQDITTVKNAKITGKEGEIIRIEVDFEKNEKKYHRKKVELKIEDF